MIKSLCLGPSIDCLLTETLGTLNLGKAVKSGTEFTGKRCLPKYTMVSNGTAHCTGWIGVSFQTCKKMCWKNAIPDHCTIINPPGGCAYAVWQENDNHAGWCHLGQILDSKICCHLIRKKYDHVKG